MRRFRRGDTPPEVGDYVVENGEIHKIEYIDNGQYVLRSMLYIPDTARVFEKRDDGQYALQTLPITRQNAQATRHLETAQPLVHRQNGFQRPTDNMSDNENQTFQR